MPEVEYGLYQYFDTTADGNGRGLISFGPQAAWERWESGTIQISNNGGNASKVEIYNNPLLTQMLEGTYKGRLDTTDTPFTLRTGEQLFLLWTGATPGSRCTATIRGRKFVQR